MASANDLLKQLNSPLNIEDALKMVAEGPVKVTIKGAGIEEIGPEDKRDSKLVLRFVEIGRSLVMNKTRLTQLSELFGDEEVDGKAVALDVRDVKVGGRLMRQICILDVAEAKVEL